MFLTHTTSNININKKEIEYALEDPCRKKPLTFHTGGTWGACPQLSTPCRAAKEPDALKVTLPFPPGQQTSDQSKQLFGSHVQRKGEGNVYIITCLCRQTDMAVNCHMNLATLHQNV